MAEIPKLRVSIRKAEKADLKAIVKIHIIAFPGFFLAEMGSLFLMQYYGTYISKSETLLVAIDDNNNVIGFVAGLLDSKGYYKLLKRTWYRFLPSIAVAMLKFKLINKCFQRVLTIFRSNKVNEEVYIPSDFHELTSIAVEPATRNIGAGRHLMQAYIEYVKSITGVKGVFLTTDFDENEKVNLFYKSLGFTIYDEFVQGGNRKMNAYTLTFHQSS